MRAAITLITTRNERSLPRRFSEGFGQMVYEAPHPGTEAPLGQIDGMNSRAVPLLILGQEPNQPSLADAGSARCSAIRMTPAPAKHISASDRPLLLRKLPDTATS